jgi:hypothetical protein
VLWPNTPLSQGYAIPRLGVNVVDPGGVGLLQVLGASIARFQSSGFHPAGSFSIALGDPTLAWNTLVSRNAILGTDSLRKLSVASGTGSTAGGATGTIASVTIPDNTVVIVDAIIEAKQNGVAAGFGYLCTGLYRRSGGVVTIEGAVGALFTAENDVTANATLVINGTAVEARGTSPAGKTLDWRAHIDTLERA